MPHFTDVETDSRGGKRRLRVFPPSIPPQCTGGHGYPQKGSDVPEVSHGVNHTHPTLSSQWKLALRGQGRRQEALSKGRGISVPHIRHLTPICEEAQGEGHWALTALGS